MATGLVVVEFFWHRSIAHPWIPTTRCKRYHNIFYTSRVIACFVSIFIAMATKVGPVKNWLTSFDSLSRRTPGRRKHLGDIFYTRRVIGDFALNFVAMATGLVVVNFVWHHSIAHQRIPRTWRKRHRDIIYTSGVCLKFCCHGNQSRSL